MAEPPAPAGDAFRKRCERFDDLALLGLVEPVHVELFHLDASGSDGLLRHLEADDGFAGVSRRLQAMLPSNWMKKG